MNERIRKVHLTITKLKEKTDHILQKLKTVLPGELFERVVDFTKKAQLSQHTKTKERQIKKFLHLQNKNFAMGVKPQITQLKVNYKTDG